MNKNIIILAFIIAVINSILIYIGTTIYTSFFIPLILTFSMVYIIVILVNNNKGLQNKIKDINKHITKANKELNQELFTKSTLKNVSEFLVIFIDTFGYIRFHNKELLGLLLDYNYLDKHLDDLNCNSILLENLNEAYLLEKNITKELHIGSKYFLFNSQIINKESNYLGSLITIKDITEIKRVEISQRNFIADASHELKTPITAIKGSIELLIDEPDMNKVNKDMFLQNIKNEVINMEEIVLDLIDITKIDRLDYTIIKEKIQISDYVNEILEKYTNNNKNIEIINKCNEDIFNIDPNKYYYVLLNLIKNAVNYTKKGYVKISNYQDDNNNYLVVEDTGIGIPTEELNNIFDRFYRVDKARNREIGGSGLGLSIAKSIIEKHNGEILVESEVNKGTKFTIKTKK